MKLKLTYLVLALFPVYLFSQVNISEIGVLNENVSENSGLIFYNNKLITHNDSGNNPVLFEIDTVSLAITRTITLSNAENVDWEDITQDDTYIYIGDIGNYRGTRTDLVIYRISKQEYSESESVMADRIDFSYEDQRNFDDNGKSNWDAEALFVFNDQLIILTKQWLDGGTVAYCIPKEPGEHLAKRLDAYQINGLVTSATYNPLSNELLILGHSNILVPFVTKITGVTANSIFGGTLDNLSFDIGFAQTEGITYVSENRYFISSEFFQREIPAITLNPLLYSLQLDNNVEEYDGTPNEEIVTNPENLEDSLMLYKSYGSNILEYELTTEKSILAQAVFDTSGKMVHFKIGSEIENNVVDLIFLKSGVYYLTFYLGDKIISSPFISN